MRRTVTLTLMAILAAPGMAWAAEAAAGDFPKAFAVLAAGIGFGLAFIESLVLFVFVIAVILLFVKS